MLTIITINLNNLAGLKRTLESISRATDGLSVNHLIVDGGSVDGSVAEIIRYAKLNRHVEYLIEPDDGIYHAMNKGINIVNTRYFAFLNSGDTINNLALIRNALLTLSTNEEIDLIYTNISYLKGETISRTWIAGEYSRYKLLLGWMPPHPMAIMKYSLIDEVGVFDESFKISGDYDLFLRLFHKKTLNLHYIDMVGVSMEAGGISNSGFLSTIRSNSEVIKSWFKLHGFYVPFWIFITKPCSKIFQLSQMQKYLRSNNSFK